MRLLQLLDTEELQVEIKNEYAKLQPVIGKELNINFEKEISDGEYVYADELGYHYILCEHGNVERHKITDDVFEVKFWAICPIIIRVSFEYEAKHRDEKLNFRKVAFEQQITYWNILGENFRKRGEIEISENLKVNPY